MLNPIAPDVWISDGPTVSFYGFPYPTRMGVVRRGDDLWIWSPVELTPELEEGLDALGTVRWLVTPNKIHHLFLPDWLEAFSTAGAWAPPGLAARRPDIVFEGEVVDGTPGPWGEAIDHVVLGGSAVMDEVLFFHRPSSTCFVGDLVQRHDAKAQAGWKGAMMRLDGLVGDEGSTPREWRASFVHRNVAREAHARALAWNPRRLVIAHGACALEDGVRVLRENLAWIERPWPV